jgi:hypothetical protein
MRIIATMQGGTRILLAIAASCLVHAALVSLPYLGQRSPLASRGLGGSLLASRAFSARLATAPKVTARALAVEPNTPNRGDGIDQSPDGPAVASSPARPRGADWLPIPAPAFYTTDQLTKSPQPAESPDLDPPQELPVSPNGKMVLRLWISALGEVTDVTTESNELTADVAAAVMANFRRTRFVPGERNGERVASVMRIEVSYDGGPAP